MNRIFTVTLTRAIYALMILAALSMGSVRSGLAVIQTASGNAPSQSTVHPADLMASALLLNALETQDAKPWHLKATYATFGNQGEPKSGGAFEEFWAGPQEYKLIYSGPNFTQTDYGTGAGMLRSGTPNWPGPAEMQLHRGLTHPMPIDGEVAGATLQATIRQSSGTLLRCISLEHAHSKEANAPPLPSAPVYCFDQEKTIVRLESSYGNAYETSFENPVEFQAHFLARDIHVTSNGKAFLNVHLETIETIDLVDEAAFTPPPDAVKPPPRRIAISSGVAQRNLLEKVSPIYPVEAKTKGERGTVVLQAVIGSDGHMKELRVVSSPGQELADAALNAVRKWTYKPYLLNGEPVEVVTQINVSFELGP